MDETRRGRTTLRAAMATTVAATAAPYGYTVTLWSSGALLVRSHGVPSVTEVFALAAGAMLAYSLVALLARGAAFRTRPLDRPGNRVRAGALNWFAVGIAISAVALLAKIHGWAVWPLSSFAATSLYLVVGSVQLAIVTVLDRRQSPTRPTSDRT